MGIQKEAQDQGIVRIWGSTVLNPYEGGRALEAGEAMLRTRRCRKSDV